MRMNAAAPSRVLRPTPEKYAPDQTDHHRTPSQTGK